MRDALINVRSCKSFSRRKTTRRDRVSEVFFFFFFKRTKVDRKMTALADQTCYVRCVYINNSMRYSECNICTGIQQYMSKLTITVNGFISMYRSMQSKCSHICDLNDIRGKSTMNDAWATILKSLVRKIELELPASSLKSSRITQYCDTDSSNEEVNDNLRIESKKRTGDNRLAWRSRKIRCRIELVTA